MERHIFQERASGVLLHISSLPGKYGIGSLGKEAYEFVDSLARCGVRYWQILPIVQTGFGDSPYQSVYTGYIPFSPDVPRSVTANCVSNRGIYTNNPR